MILKSKSTSDRASNMASSFSSGLILSWVGLSTVFMVGCSDKKEEAAKPAPAEASVAASASTPATAPSGSGAKGYVALNSDAEDGLWTNLRAVQETMPTSGLTIRVQVVEGDEARAAVGKDLAEKLKKAGFESVFESVKGDEPKPSGSALVKCHFTRAQITEKIFSAIGRFYIEGRFEMRSDDDLSKQDIVLTIHGTPVFGENGRVSFK